MKYLKKFISWIFRSLWKALRKASWKILALLVVVVIFIISPAAGMQVAMIFISFGAILYMLRAIVKSLT